MTITINVVGTEPPNGKFIVKRDGEPAVYLNHRSLLLIISLNI
jgi:hypothetical protein